MQLNKQASDLALMCRPSRALIPFCLPSDIFTVVNRTPDGVTASIGKENRVRACWFLQGREPNSGFFGYTNLVWLLFGHWWK